MLADQKAAWEAGLDRRVQQVQDAARAEQAAIGQAALAAYRSQVERKVQNMRSEAEAE